MQITPQSYLAVAALFRQAWGDALDSYDIDDINRSGLQGISPDLLAQELIDLITSDNEKTISDRGQVYWVLGKKQDKNLVPFFRRQLRIEVARDMNAAYQIMIALEDIGEKPFAGERTSYSSSEDDLNSRDAEAYLASVTG